MRLEEDIHHITLARWDYLPSMTAMGLLSKVQLGKHAEGCDRNALPIYSTCDDLELTACMHAIKPGATPDLELAAWMEYHIGGRLIKCTYVG